MLICYTKLSIQKTELVVSLMKAFGLCLGKNRGYIETKSSNSFIIISDNHVHFTKLTWVSKFRVNNLIFVASTSSISENP